MMEESPNELSAMPNCLSCGGAFNKSHKDFPAFCIECYTESNGKPVAAEGAPIDRNKVRRAALQSEVHLSFTVELGPQGYRVVPIILETGQRIAGIQSCAVSSEMENFSRICIEAITPKVE